jgi:hypothetical protein
MDKDLNKLAEEHRHFMLELAKKHNLTAQEVLSIGLNFSVLGMLVVGCSPTQVKQSLEKLVNQLSRTQAQAQAQPN